MHPTRRFGRCRLASPSGRSTRRSSLDLTARTTLPHLAAVLARADVMVGNDTGPLHLAAALGRHALGLYPPIRPMHPGRWAPLGPHADFMVFDKPDCQDCRAKPAACTCIRAIQPAAVAARVLVWMPFVNE